MASIFEYGPWARDWADLKPIRFYIKPANLYIDTTYIDTNYIDTTYIDTTYINTIYIDKTYIDATYIDATYIDPSYIDTSYIDTSYIDTTYIDIFSSTLIIIDIQFRGQITQIGQAFCNQAKAPRICPWVWYHYKSSMNHV